MNTKMTNEFLQELLDAAKGQPVQVVCYLVNGIKLEGAMLSFDDAAIKMSSEKSGNGGKPQLVMRPAISTIKPV